MNASVRENMQQLLEINDLINSFRKVGIMGRCFSLKIK
jgi:hypothetical protein